MTESEVLLHGGVGVIPTDTLYGVVACALQQPAVERVYALKGRLPTKPCIILCSSLDELALFGAHLSERQQDALSKLSGAVSFILPCDAPEYLHRGVHSLAFRVPKSERVREFLSETGPLIAPSSNPEGLPPATTIDEAQAYFGDRVDFYKDGGACDGRPSTLVSFDENDEVVVLR